jgi:hypothetical protein
MRPLPPSKRGSCQPFTRATCRGVRSRQSRGKLPRPISPSCGRSESAKHRAVHHGDAVLRGRRYEAARPSSKQQPPTGSDSEDGHYQRSSQMGGDVANSPRVLFSDQERHSLGRECGEYGECSEVSRDREQRHLWRDFTMQRKQFYQRSYEIAADEVGYERSGWQ